MKKLFLVPILASLLFCMACGSGSSGSTPVGIGSGSFSSASLLGQYVYQIAGADLNNNGAAYREAGVFIADGKGNITGGTDDFTEGSGVSSNSITGTYGISNDGTGTLTLTVAGGTLTFAITLTSTSKAYLIEADTFANGSGSIELQSPSAVSSTPSGTFVFRMHTISASQSASLVGAITASGGVISGSDDVLRGAVFDNSTGAPLTLTGSLSTPDSTGRGTGSITDSSGVTSNFVYYIVDSNNVRFLSSDASVIALGRAEKQSGSFSVSSLSGGYAFGSRGDDSNYLGGVATVGTFAANGKGSISAGAYDSVQDGNSLATSASFTGSYTAASNGRMAVTLTLPSGTAQQIFWMVSPARAFFLTNDSTKVEDGTLDQQKGSFSNSTLSGQYGFVMDGFDLNAGNFVDRVGWISGDGSGNLKWNEVVNDSGTAQQPGILTGTYAVSSNGRATATVTNLSINSNDLVFYLVSGSTGYILQNDPGIEIVGNMAAQP